MELTSYASEVAARLMPEERAEVSVSLTVTPDGVRDVEPTGAVVSLPLLEAAPNICSSFCCHVNFYASEAAAHRSVERGTEVICVADAFRLGRLIADLLTTRTAAAQQP